MSHTNFENFRLKPFLLDGVKELGFKSPTEIQEKLIPLVAKGVSAVGQSQTGTGKTHAYLLPILNKIDPTKEEVQAIITAPTRELADQIYQEILKLTKFADPTNPVRARLYIGGTDKQKSIQKLKVQPHIVVGTPGRISDLAKEQALIVHTSKILVVDEADTMLDMGFIHDVDKIAGRLAKDLQMLVFSATMPEKLKPFVKKYMENPEYIHIQPKQLTASKIEHVLIPARHRDKVKILIQALELYNPYLAIIFMNTKKGAEEVATRLSEQGVKVGRIHGDLAPRERKKMMKQIHDLEFRYIVATDLAARGIDIEGVSHVINMELPTDLDFYVHRVGRTARAGLSGFAATLYTPDDEEALEKLEKQGIPFEHRDIQSGQWVELGERNKRQTRKKQETNIDVIVKKQVKKSSQVKPGYKKKFQQEVETAKKKLRRKMNNRKK